MAATAGRMPLAVRVVSAPMVWLERSRGWKRRLLVLLYLIIALVLGLFAYRAIGIFKLPDVGEPFDVAAFGASLKVPDGQNAVPLYRQADELLRVAVPNRPAPHLFGAVIKGWTLDEPMKAWFDASRPALERWRQATERPRAVWVTLDAASTDMGASSDVDYTDFFTLSNLESSRLEEAGDFAGAWRWHRARLRYTRHLADNASLFRRAKGANALLHGTRQVAEWAENPKVPPATLREALRDLEVIDAMTPPASQTLKFQYLATMRSLDDLDEVMRGLDPSGTSLTYPYEEWRRWYQGYLFLKYEPRRTKRITKLVFANRLAWCDVPQAQRPPQVGDTQLGPMWALYEPDTEAPAATRALPPGEVIRWIGSSLIARQVTPSFAYFEPNAEAEHRRIAVLAMKVAGNLYEQEHGKEPQSPQALVDAGYLKTLPAEYRELTAEEE